MFLTIFYVLKRNKNKYDGQGDKTFKIIPERQDSGKVISEINLSEYNVMEEIADATYLSMEEINAIYN